MDGETNEETLIRNLYLNYLVSRSWETYEDYEDGTTKGLFYIINKEGHHLIIYRRREIFHNGKKLETVKQSIFEVKVIITYISTYKKKSV